MDTDSIKKLIKELNAKKIEILNESNKVQGAINALQNICDYDWRNVGHDSHKDHYKCDICGATDSY